MTCSTMLPSIIVGLLTSAIVAYIFYHVGRTDTLKMFRRTLLTSVVMRIKQTNPTRRINAPDSYDLRDTTHWLTCFSEVVREIGFTEDAECLQDVLGDIVKMPDIPEPSKEQKEEGEAKKIAWNGKLHQRISELK